MKKARKPKATPKRQAAKPKAKAKPTRGPKRKVSASPAAEEWISQQLFGAVQAAQAAGWSVNGIAQATGVPQSTLAEWIGGTRQGVSLKTAVLLASWFQMRLTEPVVPPVGT